MISQALLQPLEVQNDGAAPIFFGTGNGFRPVGATVSLVIGVSNCPLFSMAETLSSEPPFTTSFHNLLSHCMYCKGNIPVGRLRRRG